MKRKKFLVAGACLVGAGGMFLLGVMTERYWAAERMVVADALDIEQRIEAADTAAGEETIDISLIDYPEVLRSDEAPSLDHGLTDDAATHAGNAPHPAPPPARATVSPATRTLFLQIGAFGNRANAERFMAALNTKGFTPWLQTATDSAGSTRYRVRIGPFGSVDAAAPTMQKLEREGISPLVVR